MTVRQNKKQAKKGNCHGRFQAKPKWILVQLMPSCSRFLGNPFTACCVILTTNEQTKQKSVKGEKNNLPWGGCKTAAFDTRDATQQYGYYTVLNKGAHTLDKLICHNVSISVQIWKNKKTKTYVADFGVCTMGHPFIYRRAPNKSKRRTN